jgi:hypothetical protein
LRGTRDFRRRLVKLFRWVVVAVAARKLRGVDWFELRPAAKLSVPRRLDRLPVLSSRREDPFLRPIRSRIKFVISLFSMHLATIYRLPGMTNFAQPAPK